MITLDELEGDIKIAEKQKLDGKISIGSGRALKNPIITVRVWNGNSFPTIISLEGLAYIDGNIYENHMELIPPEHWGTFTAPASYNKTANEYMYYLDDLTDTSRGRVLDRVNCETKDGNRFHLKVIDPYKDVSVTLEIDPPSPYPPE